MNKLIEKDDCGNWGVKGIAWEDLIPGAIITQKTYEKVYAALWKLMEYEDTELDPEEVERINDFDKSQSGKMLKKLNEEQRKHRWIPVSERLPDSNDYILLSFSNFSLPMVGRFEDEAFYLGDDDEGDTCVSQDLFVNAWRPLPEPYRTTEE